MPNISLSQNADNALNVIYKRYQTRLASNCDNNTCACHLRAFAINSLFPNEQDSEIMSVLLELNENKLIKLFSDRHIVINDEAITYLENQLQNGYNKLTI